MQHITGRPVECGKQRLAAHLVATRHDGGSLARPCARRDEQIALSASHLGHNSLLVCIPVHAGQVMLHLDMKVKLDFTTIL